MDSTPNARRRIVGMASAALVLCIWTSFILIARHSATRTLTPLDIAFLRFAFAGVLVLPLLAWRLRRASGSGTTRLAAALPGLSAVQVAALAGVAGLAYSMLAYSGFFFAPAAHAAVLLPGSLPMWTALIATLLLRERIGRERVLGLALIVCGDLLVGGASLLHAFEGGEVWKGDLLFLCASCCWGLYTVLCRHWHVDAVDATLAIALGCLVSYVPVYALGALGQWWPSRLAQAPWSEIAFQAVFQGGLSMLVAGVAFTQVVRTFGPVRSVMITALVPGLAALLAVPLLGETLELWTVGGLAAVTLGLLVGLRAAAPRVRVLPTAT